MRRDLVPPLTDVELDHTVGVDGVPLVRVDDHTEQARVGLDKKLLENKILDSNCFSFPDSVNCVGSEALT